MVLVDMSEEGLAATKEQVDATGTAGGVKVVTANVTKSEDVQRYVDTAVSTFGAIDGGQYAMYCSGAELDRRLRR